MPHKDRERELAYWRARYRRLHPMPQLPDELVPFSPGRRVGHIVDSETGCWNWYGSRHPDGYGSIVVGGRASGGPKPAHRIYFERANGVIPVGLTIDHLCRNRACVNPAHLEAVPNAENVRRGVRSKLSHEKARHIREWFAEGGVTKRAIAKHFGVHDSVVIQVIQGKAWTEVGK